MNINLGTHDNFQAMQPEAQRAHLQNQIPEISDQLGQLRGRIVAQVGNNHPHATNVINHFENLQDINPDLLHQMDHHELLAAFEVVHNAHAAHTNLVHQYPAGAVPQHLIVGGAQEELSDLSNSGSDHSDSDHENQPPNAQQ